MTGAQLTTAIVLAAGVSRRFGQNDKLGADLRGRPLGGHIIETLSGLQLGQRIIVCRGQDWILPYAARGFEIIVNWQPERGMGVSLALGLSACRGQHILVCLADMPFVSREHLNRMLAAFHADRHHVVASSAAGYRGPPLVASADVVRDALADGDRGARSLLPGAYLVEAPPAELRDVDEPGDLHS